MRAFFLVCRWQLLAVSPREVEVDKEKEKREQGSPLLSLLIRILILSGKSPILMTSFNLNYLLKVLSSYAVTLDIEAFI